MKLTIEIDTLAQLRSIRNKTQAEVAEFLGITQQGYGLIERGKRELKIETAQKLAEFFNVDVNTIIFLAIENNEKLLKDKQTA